MNQALRTQSTKLIVAKSKAIYRGVTIMETDAGCVFFSGSKRYDCLDLNEAKALIDAAYALVLAPFEQQTP